MVNVIGLVVVSFLHFSWLFSLQLFATANCSTVMSTCVCLFARGLIFMTCSAVSVILP